MSSAVVTEPPAPPPPASPSFDFLKPLTFVFDDPRWLPKILIGGLFVIAAFFLIGVFFIYGYIARLVRNVIAGVPNPLPEWDDLGGYFSEGVKLFLVGLVYAIPLLIVAGIVFVPAIIMGSNTDNETIRSLGGMSMACVWCLIAPISLAFAIWMPGALLMVVVKGDFKAGFDFGHIFNFIRANVGNYILAFVVALVASFASQLGVLLLCVGVIFTAFWARLAGAYAFAQTYRLSSAK
ncbi:MAG TPA: DUF4013 domain-containing protein [Thermoanaerobaculia bacterium]|nr:DUF4013 domain-containing protein [Thermoanaerobaculia bacterium]